MHTRVAEMVGVEYPIFAFSHCRDVVAAVTNAGGCGVLGAVRKTPEELEYDLKWIEEQVHDRPYGVDILLPSNYAGGQTPKAKTASRPDQVPDGAEQDRFVEQLLERYAVPPMAEHLKSSLWQSHVGSSQHEPLIEVILAHNPKLFASGLGSPSADLLKRLRDRGQVVTALAGTVEHAKRHVEADVDFVVAQGTEAGGHTGQVATMVLVPDVVDAVAPVPVVAAGGIATGRQVAAGFALGAEGAWTGSVWLTTAEAEEDPVIKQKLMAARSTDTVRSRSLTGKPARMLRSAWTDAWESAEAPPTLPLPLQRAHTAEAQFRIDRAAQDRDSGAYELATYFVGQVVGRMNQERPARQVLLTMVEEYAEVLGRFMELAGE